MKASAAFTLRVMLMVACIQGGRALGEGEALRALIDRQLVAIGGFQPQRSSDAEFLRRASIDLTGMPPTSDEARAFLNDNSADKRQRLVDRIFATPQFTRRLAEMLDLMLMERRPNTNVTADEWQAWLLKSVRENKSWNMLSREILAADGADPAQRPAARFALDRGSEPNLLTRDIGRVFFGRDMQCAQCHDHPLVNDYLQSDYHGLMAFVSPTYAITHKEGDQQKMIQAERFGSDLTFQSVFVKKPRRTGARMPDGVALDEPFLLPGKEYTVAPADNVKSVPKFSRRSKLAELATNGTNQAFNRNIVNRLWAYMFGRGLVHPVDWQNPENPASNPELLKALGDRFAAMNFNIQDLVREIVLSEAYQRSYDLPPGLIDLTKPASDEVARLGELRTRLKETADASEKAYQAASAEWQRAEATMVPAAGELDTARAQYAEAKQKADVSEKAAADAKAQLETKQNLAAPLQTAATAAEQAAKSFAEDKELADAAQKLAARAQKLAAEVEVLSKAMQEKSAAIEPSTEAWNSTKPVINVALRKVEPLKSNWEQAEKAMRTARTQYEADAEALAAVDRRLKTARKVVKLEALIVALDQANQLAATRRSELAATQRQLGDYGTTVAQNDVKVKEATAALTTVSDTLNAAAAEHKKRTDEAQAIAAAVVAAEAASQKVPDDSLLSETVKKLKERAATADAAAEDAQRQLASATTAQQSAAAALAGAKASLDLTAPERIRHEQAVSSAKEALAAAEAGVAGRQAEFDAAIADVAESWTRDFTLASLKPLSPEQLCWTVFRVTGVYDRYWNAEVAELDKAKPLTEEQKKDPTQLAVRDVELEQRTYDKLKPNIGTFVAFYGAGAGQPQSDFFSTADQALFAGNGGGLNAWVAPANDNVTERIIKQTDPRSAAEELYLAVLTRMPTDEEAAEVVACLNQRTKDKNVAAQELVWALLNTAEFRFNH